MREINVVVECTGLPDMIELGFNMLSPSGRMILVGQPDYGHSVEFHVMRQHYCGKTMMDSQGGLTDPTVDIPRYLNMYECGKLKLDGLITSYFGLEHANEAINTMKSGIGGRVCLEMD
jgi:Zn-dependent alcohol dehydrogenase